LIIPFLQFFSFVFTWGISFVIYLNILDINITIPYIYFNISDLITTLLIIQLINLVRKFISTYKIIVTSIERGNYDVFIINLYISVILLLLIFCGN
jgi:hypothetical protein